MRNAGNPVSTRAKMASSLGSIKMAKEGICFLYYNAVVGAAQMGGTATRAPPTRSVPHLPVNYAAVDGVEGYKAAYTASFVNYRVIVFVQ